MAQQDKDAGELASLAAEQAGHAAKNIGRAASEAVEDLLPTVPMTQEGIAFAVRVSNKTLMAGLAVGGLMTGVAVGKRVKAAVKLRLAERNAKKEIGDKVVSMKPGEVA